MTQSIDETGLLRTRCHRPQHGRCATTLFRTKHPVIEEGRQRANRFALWDFKVMLQRKVRF